MPADNLYRDIIIISSDEEDCKDELDEEAYAPNAGQEGLRTEGLSYEPSRVEVSSSNSQHRGSASVRAARATSTQVRTAHHNHGAQTNTWVRDDVKREGSALGSPDCPAHRAEEAPLVSEVHRGTSGTVTPLKLEESDRRSTTTAVESSLNFTGHARDTTLGPISKKHDVLRELIATCSTHPPSSYVQAAHMAPRSSPSERSSSVTLPSEPRHSSPDPLVVSLPIASEDAREGSATSPKISETTADNSLVRTDGEAHQTSPTPSEGEVDRLIQVSQIDDLETTPAPVSPLPPSPPSCTSISATQSASTYIIPPDVPWRQPQQRQSDLADWARAYAVSRAAASQPLSWRTLGASYAEEMPAQPVLNDIAQEGLYTIAGAREGSSQGTHNVDVPPPPGVEDPVVRFLKEVSLSPTLADTLREVGVSDEQRIQALGALHWRSLDKLDKALAQAGLDYVARLLIRDGLKKRASQGQPT
ncbi:hypothetical protein L226DRAFT_565418 [Lentinus tigrinus ALCF2SS1-7]|uniref:uncharacterized protein n=1 Tax=Lentinus tigrinus ALCF2SS1-7 TaxID=1328758 RepID=UPI001165D469|nr:hypothetical protein L226DRAFT_565418 [Lentinus tigrinus ALCF2SS1-7]